jgi:hypothetical protein
MLGAISIVFLTALLVYSILTKEQTTTKKITHPTTAPFIVPKKEDTDPPPFGKKVQQPSQSMKTGITPTLRQLDSNSYAQPTIIPPDSNALIKDRGDVIIIPPAAAKKDSEPNIKRKKGVSGLTDEDYRIEPRKKDSLP